MNFMKKTAILLATGFGLGHSPWAPGTVGSFWGVLLCLLINHYLGVPGQIVVGVVFSLLAIPICSVAEKHFGTKDPHCIVADEYMTFSLCMIGLPLNPWMLAIAFVSNRFFDIVKLPPAYSLQRLQGGLGIVVDDVFASLYSLAVNWAAYLLLLHYRWL